MDNKEKINIKFSGSGTGIATITGWRLALFLYFLWKSLVGLMFGRTMVKYRCNISEDSIMIFDLNNEELGRLLMKDLVDVVKKMDENEKKFKNKK